MNISFVTKKMLLVAFVFFIIQPMYPMQRKMKKLIRPICDAIIPSATAPCTATPPGI